MYGILNSQDKKMDLKNKVAIVTGAGQGIGRAIATALADYGALVLVNDIDESLLMELPEGCKGFAGDVSKSEVIEDMVQTCIQELGGIDILVANAGITLFGDFFKYPLEDLKKVIDLNLIGTFQIIQQVGKYMKDKQRGGSILIMSSVTGHQAHKNLAAYGMTKAALELLVKHLVLEFWHTGITINALAPGATLTERTTSEVDYEETWARLNPTGKANTVEDVAAAALFLVSPKAGQITGQTLVIDGGWSCVSPSPF
jgi:3-oxoacyl-[acyl-carrier protein] reductase